MPTPHPDVMKVETPQGAPHDPPARSDMTHTARYLLGIVAVGLVSAAFAIAFRGSLHLLTMATVDASNIVLTIEKLPFWARILMPAVGALLGGLVSRFLIKVGGSVGDVMEAVVIGRVNLSMRGTLLKSLASWLAIAGGGSLGREGPLIQFGGASGKTVGQALKLPIDQIRILIAAGTAAGFAAAYNTPFAAVLFVVEVVMGVVVIRALWPVLIATVLATGLTRWAIGPGPLYGVQSFAVKHAWELLAFVGLAFVVALGAQGFMRVLSFAEEIFKGPIPMPWRPALGGLLAGLVIAFMPEIAGNGFEPLLDLISGKFTWTFVIFLLIGKVFATTASVSSGSPGGVFTPTLLLGGGLGFLYATALGQVVGQDMIMTGSYALVGMAAATAATTHAPVMASVMVFELTGDYAIVLPLLLATAISAAFSKMLRKDSIYTAELKAKGVDRDANPEASLRD